VIVSRRSAGEIASARRADACSPLAVGAAGASSFASAGPPASAQTRSDQPKADSRPSKGVLGVKFARKALGTVADIPPWLYALLGVAIALLAVAALPPHATQNRQTAVLLAHRRGMIASAGAAALAAAMIAYALH
jgi:hypothetical protein